LWLSGSRAAGWTIEWGDDFFGTDTTSTGSLLDGSFSVELGTFGGYVPDAANPWDWQQYWKPMDFVSYNPATRNFAGQVQLTFHDQPPGGEADYFTSDYVSPGGGAAPHFYEGEQAYIWIYNSRSPAGSVEWALFTRQATQSQQKPNWLLPVGDGGPQAFPLLWYVPGTDASPAGSVSVPQSGPSSFSTERIAAPIPEPSAAVALIAAGTILILRRRNH
jgi:hypothetical protein